MLPAKHGVTCASLHVLTCGNTWCYADLIAMRLQIWSSVNNVVDQQVLRGDSVYSSRPSTPDASRSIFDLSIPASSRIRSTASCTAWLSDVANARALFA